MKPKTKRIILLSFLIIGFGFASVFATDTTVNPAALVTQHLQLDSRIDAANVQVSSAKGKIVLSGTMGSLAEQDLAEEIVKQVVGNNYSVAKLKVTPPFVSDNEIQKNILTSVPAHCLVEIHDFQAQVQQGNVTLNGRANALHHSRIAEFTARNTRGVKSVANRIQITGPSPSDQLIEESVFALLNPYLKQNDIRINVDVKNGVVKLTGEVKSYDQERTIKETAQNCKGVTKVESQLKRAREPFDKGSRI